MKNYGLRIVAFALVIAAPAVGSAANAALPSSRHAAAEQSDVKRRFQVLMNAYHVCLRDPFPSEAEQRQCESDQIDGAEGIVSRSKANKLLHRFLLDLFPAWDDKISGGGHDSGFVHELTVLQAYKDFAFRRASILTGQLWAYPPPFGDRFEGMKLVHRKLQHRFDWMTGRAVAETLRLLDQPKLRTISERRWQVIRDEDCRAYPVRNCAARLDKALLITFEELLSLQDPWVRD